MSDLLDDHLFDDEKEGYKFSMSLALFWCGLFFLGAIFRLMHWPGSGLLLLGSSAGLMAYSISALITLKGKSMGNNFSLGVAFILIGYYAFKVMRLQNFNFLVGYGILLLGFFALFQIIKYIRSRRKNRSEI